MQVMIFLKIKFGKLGKAPVVHRHKLQPAHPGRAPCDEDVLGPVEREGEAGAVQATHGAV